MGRRWPLVLIGCLVTTSWALAAEISDVTEWKRIDSRYCTIWLDPIVESKHVNKRVSTWRVRPKVRASEDESLEGKIAAKFDTIFRRAQEILDMYSPGIHTTIKIVKDQSNVEGIHAKRYGYGTKAVAFYLFEENTIYVAVKDLSEGVLAHEMAHCIIDHYFQVRPPRKVEELLAMHVDTQLRN